MNRFASPADYIKKRMKNSHRESTPVLMLFLNRSKKYLSRKFRMRELPKVVAGEGLIGGKSIAGVDPLYGASAAVLTLEETIRHGYKNFLFLGACGALDYDLKIGDLILPERAISEEGTSKLYTSGKSKFQANKNLAQLIESTAKEEGIKTRRGIIWTTDAPYMETLAKIQKFRKLGTTAVEMETSALFAVAKVRRVRIAGLLVVSDLLHDKWIIGWRRKSFYSAEDKALEVIIKTALKISETLEI